jgi:thioredoxin 1
MLELNKENFEAEIKTENGLALVDWWGPKCAPCLALLPRIEAMAGRYEGRVKFAKVNVNENRRLAIGERIMGLPTLTLYQAGQPVASWSGDEARADAIEAKLKELLG